MVLIDYALNKNIILDPNRRFDCYSSNKEKARPINEEKFDAYLESEKGRVRMLSDSLDKV